MTIRTYPAPRHPVARVAAATSWGMWPVLAMFLAIVLPIFVVVGVLTFTFGDNDTSVWQIAGSGAMKYFPMAIAIMMTPAYLPIYVAQGVTRRYIALGGAGFIAIWSGLITAVVAIGYALEALIFRLIDVDHTFDQPHLFDQWYDVHLIATQYGLLVAAHMMVGWLIGTVYYRLRWFWGTLLLPVTLLPAVAVEYLLGTGWAGAGLAEFTAYTRPPLAVVLPAALLVILLTWAINTALIRTIPIRLKNG